MNDALVDAFGEVATVQRGAGAVTPVRVVVLRNVQKVGDYGQVVARVNTASFINAQWEPQSGDVLVSSLGTRKVSSIEADDGFMTTVVVNA
jgi:hypothetical protein